MVNDMVGCCIKFADIANKSNWLDMKYARNIPWPEKLEQNELTIAKMRKTIKSEKVISFVGHQMFFLENIELKQPYTYTYIYI